MRTRFLASFCAITFLTVLARAETVSDNFSAAELNAVCSGSDTKVCAAYLAGFSRGFYYAAVSTQAGYAPCLPRGLPKDQARLIVTSFMSRHAEMMQQGAPSVVAAAFIDAFPCSAQH